MKNVYSNILTKDNWHDFENLFEKHHGVRGGCWCSFYITYAGEYNKLDRCGRKATHLNLIKNDLHTGLLVYENEIPVAWCQFGKPDILKRYNRNRIYEKLQLEKQQKPSWRISCIFVDKDYRNLGYASIAIKEAISYIKMHGGGLIEVFPFEFEDESMNKFQHNGSVSFYEALGFRKIQKVSKYEVLMRRFIQPEE